MTIDRYRHVHCAICLMDVPTEETDENGETVQRQLHIGRQLVPVEGPDGTIAFGKRNVIMCEDCAAKDAQRRSVSRLIMPGAAVVQQ